jgi:hypothetical protein
MKTTTASASQPAGSGVLGTTWAACVGGLTSNSNAASSDIATHNSTLPSSESGRTG